MEPVFIIQTRLVRVDNTEDEKVKIKRGKKLYNHEELCRMFEKTDSIIKDAARNEDVYLIDLSETLTGKSWAFHDHIHLSPQGSNKLAEIVAEDLEKLL